MSVYVCAYLEEDTIELVDEENRADTLADGLAKHSLGLHAHTLNAVDDDEGTIRHAEGGRHLRREIDVTGRVDQVDEERSLSDARKSEQHTQTSACQHTACWQVHGERASIGAATASPPAGRPAGNQRRRPPRPH